MTDPKGDRSLAPTKQLDLTFHPCRRTKSDGIIIRGAKAHMTGGVNSHEILIMPTQAMREEDKIIALVLRVSLNTPGVVSSSPADQRRRKFERAWTGNPFRTLVRRKPLIISKCLCALGKGFPLREHDMAGILVERFATNASPELWRV